MLWVAEVCKFKMLIERDAEVPAPEDCSRSCRITQCAATTLWPPASTSHDTVYCYGKSADVLGPVGRYVFAASSIYLPTSFPPSLSTNSFRNNRLRSPRLNSNNFNSPTSLLRAAPHPRLPLSHVLPLPYPQKHPFPIPLVPSNQGLNPTPQPPPFHSHIPNLDAAMPMAFSHHFLL